MTTATSSETSVIPDVTEENSYTMYGYCLQEALEQLPAFLL